MITKKVGFLNEGQLIENAIIYKLFSDTLYALNQTILCILYISYRLVNIREYALINKDRKMTNVDVKHGKTRHFFDF